jgi:hypothetical protein
MRKWLISVCLAVALVCPFVTTGALARDRCPGEYFMMAPGSQWTMWTHFLSPPPPSNFDDRWSFVDVVSDTVFGIPDEVTSYRVEESEYIPGEPDTSTHRIVYYAYDRHGNLGYAAYANGDSLIVFDSVVVILRNPIVVGDSVYLDGPEWQESYVVLSVSDTLQTPYGVFQNCLRWRERSWVGGVPNEVNEERYIPAEYLQQFGGIGWRHTIHFGSGAHESVARIVSTSGLAGVATLPEPPHNGISYAQIYPNPVPCVVDVAYGLTSPTAVSVQLFNVRGQLVDTIEPGYEYAGDHAFRWPLGRATSGVYFLRIIAGSSSTVRRVVIVR